MSEAEKAVELLLVITLLQFCSDALGRAHADQAALICYVIADLEGQS